MAILKLESDAREFLEHLLSTEAAVMSAGSYLEAGIVADRSRDPRASREFDRLLRELRIEVVPVTEQQATIARAAYRDFGRGSGHPAGLNFGDCFAYALAQDRNDTLLYKGDDFSHTDVRSALAQE
jgi:ribonuclease VapC